MSSGDLPATAAEVDHDARLTRFYEKYNPEKLPTIGDTLKKYEGKEEKLFAALVGKYGAEPEAPADVSAARPSTTSSSTESSSTKSSSPSADVPQQPSAIDHHARLTRFYEKYNPEKLPTVGDTLNKYAGREEVLFAALVGKYGAGRD
jgi:cytoskeletal protein RodZ